MNFPEIYSATGMMELIQKSDLKAALYEKDSFKYHINRGCNLNCVKACS